MRELQTALAQVKTLQGWIRICANCKRVLNDAGIWEQFESNAGLMCLPPPAVRQNS